MLVKGAPIFNEYVVSVDDWWPKGTKPLITCNDIHFIQIDSKIQIIVSHSYFDIWKILQENITIFFMKV